MYALFLATQPIYDFLGVPEQNGITFERGDYYQREEDSGALLAFSDRHFFDLAPERSFKEKRNCHIFSLDTTKMNKILLRFE